MTEINRLSAIDTLSIGDLIAFWIANQSDPRKVSLSVLLAFMQDNLTFSTGAAAKVTQYSAPSATAFNVPITDSSSSIWLLLQPTGTFAAGTITLPSVANAVDNQEVLVNCTQIVTTLTVDGNGATGVTGEPATLAANDFFLMRYNLTFKTWYRVG